MLDRVVVLEFIESELDKDAIPPDINKEDLAEAFAMFTEDDIYLWLKDNFKSFFYPGTDGIDWNSIRGKMKEIKNV